MEKYLFGFSEWGGGKFTKANTVDGCSHRCKYCGVAAQEARVNMRSPEKWPIEEVNVKTLAETIGKRNSLLIYPTSHDITPQHLDVHLYQIRRILEAGNKLLICSKMHYDCIVEICAECFERKEQVELRCTIGSRDSETLRWWEPGAPDYDERKAAVEYAYRQGYDTSISGEPMLDASIERVVEDMRPSVSESIWIGKMNHARQNLTLNGVTGPMADAKVSALLAWQDDDANIMRLVERYANDPLIRWKESIQRVIDKYTNNYDTRGI